MISKEDVTINVKFEDSCQQDWALAGAVAWNMIPNLFMDTRGEWKARLFYIYFANSLGPDAQRGLYEKSMAEFSRFYRKCSLAYLWWCQQGYGRQVNTPSVFVLACKRAISERNPFQGFMLSSDWIRQRDEMTAAERKESDKIWVPNEEVMAQFRLYVSQHNLKSSLTPNLLPEEMKIAGFVPEKGTHDWPPDDPRPKTTTWYRGLIFLREYSHNLVKEKGQTKLVFHRQ
jgi:hypothetical protein